MEKWLKSCTGILLRADRARPSLPLWQKSADWLNWPRPVRSAHLCRVLIIFFHKKLEIYFALFIFLDFRTVCQVGKEGSNMSIECPKNVQKFAYVIYGWLQDKTDGVEADPVLEPLLKILAEGQVLASKQELATHMASDKVTKFKPLGKIWR